MIDFAPSKCKKWMCTLLKKASAFGIAFCAMGLPTTVWGIAQDPKKLEKPPRSVVRGQRDESKSKERERGPLHRGRPADPPNKPKPLDKKAKP